MPSGPHSATVPSPDARAVLLTSAFSVGQAGCHLLGPLSQTSGLQTSGGDNRVVLSLFFDFCSFLLFYFLLGYTHYTVGNSQ